MPTSVHLTRTQILRIVLRRGANWPRLVENFPARPTKMIWRLSRGTTLLSGESMTVGKVTFFETGGEQKQSIDRRGVCEMCSLPGLDRIYFLRNYSSRQKIKNWIEIKIFMVFTFSYHFPINSASKTCYVFRIRTEYQCDLGPFLWYKFSIQHRD